MIPRRYTFVGSDGRREPVNTWLSTLAGRCRSCNDDRVIHVPSGVDACPVCSAKAEADYQGSKNARIA